MGNLALDQVTAGQSSPEVTVNAATDKLDKALTEALAVNLTNDVALSNAQYRGNIFFNVTTSGTSKTLTFPAIKRKVYVSNTSTHDITLACGSTTFSLLRFTQGAIVLTDGTTNGLTVNVISKALPSGGSTGDVLTKGSGTNFDIGWSPPGAATNGLPVGGTTGQILTKNSVTNFDASWATGGGGGGSSGENTFNPPPAQGSWDHTVTQSSVTYGQGGSGGTATTWILYPGRSGDAISTVLKDISNSGTGGASGWQATFRFRRWFPLWQWSNTGIIVSDGTKYIVMGLGRDNTCGINRDTYSTATTGKSDSGILTLADANNSSLVRDIWMRVKDDTTNRIYYISWDGFTWEQIFTETRATFLTHTRVGFGGTDNVASAITGWQTNSGGVKLRFECLSFDYLDLP